MGSAALQTLAEAIAEETSTISSSTDIKALRKKIAFRKLKKLPATMKSDNPIIEFALKANEE